MKKGLLFVITGLIIGIFAGIMIYNNIFPI